MHLLHLFVSNSTEVPIVVMDGVPTPLRCFRELHSAEMFVDDGVESVTSVQQVIGGRFAPFVDGVTGSAVIERQ